MTNITDIMFTFITIQSRKAITYDVLIPPAFKSIGRLQKEMLNVFLRLTHFYDDISITLSNNQLTDVYVNLFANNCRLRTFQIFYLADLLKTRVRFIDVALRFCEMIISQEKVTFATGKSRILLFNKLRPVL